MLSKEQIHSAAKALKEDSGKQIDIAANVLADRVELLNTKIEELPEYLKSQTGEMVQNGQFLIFGLADWLGAYQAVRQLLQTETYNTYSKWTNFRKSEREQFELFQLLINSLGKDAVSPQLFRFIEVIGDIVVEKEFPKIETATPILKLVKD